MDAPVLLAVDEDPGSLKDVERELRERYEPNYRVIATCSPVSALEALERLAADEEEEVALVLAGESLDGTSGTEVLVQTHRLHPHAKRGLLMKWGGWADPDTGRAVYDAMAHGRIDYYVLRPSGSPDELFHHTLSGFLLEWVHARRRAPHTIHVIGESWSGRAHELRSRLRSCALPHSFCLADSDEGRELIAGAGTGAPLPLIVFPDGRVLSDPTDAEIATAAGAPVESGRNDFDLVIVGAGPAGLSAAVYGASEGLRTLIVDQAGVGGQASSSALIRNYLGFPRGVSGGRLAEQAYEQAWVFGAKFVFMQTAVELRGGDELTVRLSDQGDVTARAVILATGATYRLLGIPELEKLNGAGVFYGGTGSEAHAMADKDVYVVGGANSAAQAALHLGRYARQITLVVRTQSLDAGMSHYLARQIEATRNVDVRLGTEIVGGGGDDGWLEHLVLREGSDAEEETVRADGLFVMIGARPHTDWLPDGIARDARGFVLTGPDVADCGVWPLERTPLLLETTMPGVFAAGDVRHGSAKRVASAVGEGSVAIQQVHALLAADRLRPAVSSAFL